MTRGQAWRFLEIGRRVERVDFIARFVRGTLVAPGNDPALLEAVSGSNGLFSHLPAAISDATWRRTPWPTCCWLMKAIPAAPLFNCCNSISIWRRCRAKARSRTGIATSGLLLKLRTLIQLADLVELCQVPVEQPRQALDALLAETTDQIARLSDAIARLYFSHAEFSRELGEVSQDPT